MLIGAHVSTAGGLVQAYERGVELGCDAIQIFHQSPRMWRPTNYHEEDVAAFNERLAAGPVRSVAIHAVYLINCASRDRTIRKKSLDALVHALRLGDAIGAAGVVLHPGSQVKEPHAASMKRVGKAIQQVLGESESCPLLLENTAGAGGTLGRSFEELAELIELGGGERIGLCLDCCHMLASGFDITSAEKLSAVVEDCVSSVSLERLGCLHVNDSQAELGSNRDRHAVLPEGELGEEGLAAFLSEPRFEGLPALLETKASAEQVQLARDLRERGLRARRGGRGGRTPPRRKPAGRRSRG